MQLYHCIRQVVDKDKTYPSPGEPTTAACLQCDGSHAPTPLILFLQSLLAHGSEVPLDLYSCLSETPEVLPLGVASKVGLDQCGCPLFLQSITWLEAKLHP